MKKKIILTIGLVGFISLGAITYNSLDSINAETAKEETKIVYRDANYIGNFEDQRQVAGAAQNIFIGQVIKQSGTESRNDFPETQYEVKVLKNIKGKQKGLITVNQQGGYRKNTEEQDELVLFEGDKLLQEGKLYLFATRYSEEKDWNTVIPQYGDVLIEGEEKQNKLVQEFTKAYKEQIIPKVLQKKNEKTDGLDFETEQN